MSDGGLEMTYDLEKGNVLVENSLRHNFSNAWTQGLLSVRNEVFGGSCDRKCLDVTRQPGDLLKSSFL